MTETDAERIGRMIGAAAGSMRIDDVFKAMLDLFWHHTDPKGISHWGPKLQATDTGFDIVLTIDGTYTSADAVEVEEDVLPLWISDYQRVMAALNAYKKQLEELDPLWRSK